MKYLSIFLFIISSVCHASIADLILKKYQSNLPTLPARRQEHFAVRMYSITGDSRYIPPLLTYLSVLSGKVRYLSENLNQQVIADENKKLLVIRDQDSDKRKIRIKRISEYKDKTIAFSLHLLFLMSKIHFYTLDNTPLFPNTSILNQFLNSQKNNFSQFILDKENIKIFGPQLINYVYNLYDLNIIDLRSRYALKFMEVFPDEQDSTLSEFDYAAKIYGLTHFITAASHYYQNNYCDYRPFNWIIDYFEKHIDEIITRTENDIIAEVGICLMLVNKADSGAIKKIKSHLNSAYDTHYQMIPNKEGSFDFAKGEHRNILTIMLFKWPEKLTPITISLLQTTS